MYVFTGNFEISNDCESVRYTLYQDNPQTNTSAQLIKSETVPVLRDGKDGKNGSNGKDGKTGSIINFTPNSIDITVDREGDFAETREVQIKVTATRDGQPLTLSSIGLKSGDTFPTGISLARTDISTGTIVLKITAGRGFASSSDDFAQNIFVATTVDGEKGECAVQYHKVGAGISLGRISYIPTSKTLSSVSYTNSDNSVIITNAIAHKNDKVVLVADVSPYSKGTVFVYDGSKWNDTKDINASIVALEDILSIADGTSAQVICKTLITQQAFIRELCATVIGLSYKGEIKSGYYVDPYAYSSGIQIKGDGTVNIKGASLNLTSDDVPDLSSKYDPKGSADNAFSDSKNYTDEKAEATYRISMEGAEELSSSWADNTLQQLGLDVNADHTIVAGKYIQTKLLNVNDIFTYQLTLKSGGFLQSSNYVNGGGFRISDNGDAVFRNGTFSGTLVANSMEMSIPTYGENKLFETYLWFSSSRTIDKQADEKRYLNIYCTLYTSLYLDIEYESTKGDIYYSKDECNTSTKITNNTRLLLDFTKPIVYRFRLATNDIKVKFSMKCNYPYGTVGSYILQSALNINFDYNNL